jgi:hypothetical protein
MIWRVLEVLVFLLLTMMTVEGEWMVVVVLLGP